MDSKDTANVNISVMVWCAFGGGSAIIGVYVWQMVTAPTPNAQLSLLAGTVIGSMLTLAGKAWTDYTAANKPATPTKT